MNWHFLTLTRFTTGRENFLFTLSDKKMPVIPVMCALFWTVRQREDKVAASVGAHSILVYKDRPFGRHNWQKVGFFLKNNHIYMEKDDLLEPLYYTLGFLRGLWSKSCTNVTHLYRELKMTLFFFKLRIGFNDVWIEALKKEQIEKEHYLRKTGV